MIRKPRVTNLEKVTNFGCESRFNLKNFEESPSHIPCYNQTRTVYTQTYNDLIFILDSVWPVTVRLVDRAGSEEG